MRQLGQETGDIHALSAPRPAESKRRKAMSEAVAYRSHVRIERIKGPLRRAYLPAEPRPVLFGVHSEIAEHYGVDPNVHEPHAATLDYFVAATAG